MQLEYQLRTEIEFWQDILDTCPEDECPGTLERAVQARKLAENRLDLFLSAGGRVLN